MTDGEAASGDAPLDLVTVLDVSGSMTGAKLALLKQAVGFVIDNLRPQDRLSVVSISSGGAPCHQALADVGHREGYDQEGLQHRRRAPHGGQAVKVTDGETALTKVSCNYRDTDGGAHVDVMAEDTVVARPEPEHVVDAERSTEVERERVRVEATEDNAAARAAAERGAHQEAVEILESRQRAVAQSAAALGGDPTILALGAELHDMPRFVSNGKLRA
ncbi:unnamed protein product [Miscanthus lutarioriparius]|uniref:VWFA domain-containing protein n=1 Tax=Miscanthus lutarioriparius TaxID=422564 RepID=A0A811P9N8_9POAL|nr:unnamed protein product [Miscanthus lutarioriparius]